MRIQAYALAALLTASVAPAMAMSPQLPTPPTPPGLPAPPAPPGFDNHRDHIATTVHHRRHHRRHHRHHVVHHPPTQ
jgi:hypothetical protein